MTTQDYIQENEKRKAKLFPYYDPLTGIGSPIPRFEVKINKLYSLFLPNVVKPMFPDDLCADVQVYCKENNMEVEDMMVFIENIRYKYDFEYYAAKVIKIKDKRTSKDIPFILNNPQRLVWGIVHDMLFNNKPVRIDILKCRKWGGSTEVNAIFNWIQAEVKTGWNSCIVTDVEDQARGIRAMTTKFSLNYPSVMGTFSLAPHEGSTKNKYIPERDCTISIGSMAKPDSLRSGTTYLVHLSEIGLWKATLGKKPEDLIQTVLEMVMEDTPWTCIFRESTAKGTGSYFEKVWLQDKRGESNYTPIFIPWYIEETNMKPIQDMDKFISSLNEYDLFCWNEGATLEGLNWYKNKLKNYSGDHYRMQSENPTTDIEAFNSTGHRAFHPDYVKAMRKHNMEPMFKGDITADAIIGKKAFDNITHIANPTGLLWIWALPDTEIKCANRYAVAVDIGGKWEGADFSTIRVYDRIEMMYGGGPEAILTWVGHIDQDLLIWKAGQIAYWYNKALLVPEANSLKKDTENSEGSHIFTFLDTLRDVYPNIFCRTDPEKIRQGAPAMYGYWTGHHNKPTLVTGMNAKMREIESNTGPGYIEYDSRVCDEYDAYEIKDDGTYGNVDGYHDDLVMNTMIGIDVCTNLKLMPAPYMIEENKQRHTRVVHKTEAFL